MLDANLKTQLQAYLEKAVRPIHITAFLDDSDASAELQSLLRDLKEVSDRISVTEQRGGERTPSFSLTSPGHDIHLTFAGLPMGHEFTSLVLALLQVGGHPSKLAQDVIEQIRSLDGQYRFETYFSLSCQNCPDVVQALNLMAVLNPNIQHVAIDGALFQQEVEQREVMSVPTIFLNGEVFGADGMVEVHLANGASLKSKTVILSTGARWRQMNVPGENEYRNKGVAYCPHCDGPLFKGKRVAVIGGGNSGVEAAIDLAGIVAQVTLIEFDGKLRADEVLQRKLHSLPNVRVVTSAQTTEVLGDGSKVTGLVYKDRAGGDTHRVELEGIFVQIGLLPNTEWLKGVVELSPRGEIVIDDRGQTSVPGVFAAGDATTVPYKQIVIAMGEGSKAALSAFDHLIRSSAPVETADAVAA